MEEIEHFRYSRMEFNEANQHLHIRYDAKDTDCSKTIARVLDDRYASDFIYYMRKKGLRADPFTDYGSRKEKHFTFNQMNKEFKKYCKKNKVSMGLHIALLIIFRKADLLANRAKGVERTDWGSNVFINNDGDAFFNDQRVKCSQIEEAIKDGRIVKKGVSTHQCMKCDVYSIPDVHEKASMKLFF